jgi:ParB-like chromosome segregation protein Spo0J
MAAQRLGIEDVPCMVARGWSEAQRRAYVIADNKLAQNAGWDDELLGVEFADLRGMGFDLGLTGFSDLDIGEFLAERTEGETDPDEVPEIQAQAVTVRGDVWLLGAYFECAECKKQFSYAEGLPFKDDGCPCGKA